MEHADCRNNAGNCWVSEWMQKNCSFAQILAVTVGPSHLLLVLPLYPYLPKLQSQSLQTPFAWVICSSWNLKPVQESREVARSKKDSPSSTRMSQKHPAVPTACQEFQVWGAWTASLATAPSAEFPSVFSGRVNERNIPPVAPSIQGGSQSPEL